MTRLFGTDGVRGLANDLLTPASRSSSERRRPRPDPGNPGLQALPLRAPARHRRS